MKAVLRWAWLWPDGEIEVQFRGVTRNLMLATQRYVRMKPKPRLVRVKVSVLK